MTGCTEPRQICNKKKNIKRAYKAHSKNERQEYENIVNNNDRMYKYYKYLTNNKNKQRLNKEAQKGINQI